MMRKKILTTALALCMTLTLLPAVSVPALAGAESFNVATGIRLIDGGQDSSIYFGAYPQSSDGEGGYSDNPIKWRVLDDNGGYYAEASVADQEAFDEETYYIFDADSQEFIRADAYDSEATYYEARSSLLLFADQNLDAKPYHTSYTPITWETCTLRSWLNGYDSADENGANAVNPYDGSFIGSAFTVSGQDAIAETAFSDSVKDKIFLLSKDEADTSDYGFSSDAARVSGNTAYTESILNSSTATSWWLRSCHSEDEVDYVHSGGYFSYCNGDYASFADRPACNLDYDSVLFSAAAGFDNSSDFARTQAYSGSDWKLTLLDGNDGFNAEVQRTTAVFGGSVTVDVTSLGSGHDYTQISAMLICSGDIIYYGSIGEASTGEVSFDVPSDLNEGSYTLRLFAEDAGGPYATSFASNTVDVSLTVTDPYDVYPFGTKVKLTDDSVWIVVEDGGREEARFTLVMDGFLSGDYSRSDADTALSDYQETTRDTFDDDEAQTRLPTEDEVWALWDINPFSDQNTGYWLADDEMDGGYQWANGNASFGWANPDFYTGSTNSVRPVLTVLKSALLAFEPFITQQPQDADLPTLAGDDAEFSVEAVGDNLAYQWQVLDGEDWADIAGAEEAALTIEAESENYAAGKTFRCQLDSDWGEPVYSGEAKLVTFDWQQYGEAFASAGTDYTVSEDGETVTLHTAAGLGWLAAQVNSAADDFEGKTVALDCDIDLTGRTFLPIGVGDDEIAFCGHFDGGMHTVSGMAVRSVYYYSGLFGVADNAVIENLLITDGSVCVAEDTIDYGDFYVGALCGLAYETTIRNVGVGPVTVSGRDDEGVYYLGGIVGYLWGENVETCIYNAYSRAVLAGGTAVMLMSSSDVYTESDAGGIAGYVRGDTVANCYFAGTIEAAFPRIGGVAGFSRDGEFSDCFWQTDDSIPCGYYMYDESSNTVAGNTGCTQKTAAQMKSADTVTALNAFVTAGNAAAGSSVYKLWGMKSTVNGGYPVFEAAIPVTTSGGHSSSRTITVTETSSPLYSDAQGAVRAEANMTRAFSNSIEVRVTDTDESASGFGLGLGNTVYPFDISLYIKGTNTKTEPKDGYAVTISLPVPDELLDVKEQLSVAHISDDGTVTTLKSQLKQINGVWYLVFEATEFSPYALVVNGTAAYDETAGLPYYVDSDGKEVFIGFTANGKYIAPFSVTVLFRENAKAFTDIGSHWAKNYIEFVTTRELFLGTGSNTFSPDTGMTRAMFATVVGRLYERSYGEIEVASTHAFTDCDYADYYGKYVDWAAGNGILAGYGNGKFGPDDPVTREQMAAILYRFGEFLGVLPDDTDTDLSYPDAGTISSWALSAALCCQSTGIITGRDGGSFVPQGTATRAEVAAIIQRFIESVMA